MIKNNIVYTWFDFEVKKAEGSFLWDSNGNKLIDFVSGWNVTNLGWNYPDVNDAVIKQAKNNVYSEMWTPDPVLSEYANELVKSFPKELNTVVRSTGGTEANEEAIKISRAFTGRKKILGFSPSYHGQSLSDLSISYGENLSHLGVPLSNFENIPFPTNNLDKFEKDLENVLKKEDVSAVVTEAGIVTGWGKTTVAPKGFLKLVRKLTKKYGTLLILDEVGTGFGRCGKLFALEIENVVPDIVTLAKGISNGASAIGALVLKREIAEVAQNKSMLISTFGWNPLACAAALATLKAHKKLKTGDLAYEKGKYIKNTLKSEFKNKNILEDVRGLGLELGISFADQKELDGLNIANRVQERAKEKGLHLIVGDENNIQLMPSLLIDKKTLDKGLDIFIDVTKEIIRNI